MYQLLIDSTYKEIVLVLYCDNKVFKTINETSFNGSSNLIMPLIFSLFNSNNISPQSLKEVFIVNGPGSFTGTRIGVTIAKTLAYSLNIPIKTISSLEMKSVSSKLNSKKLCVLNDPNGYYVGLFNKDNFLTEDYLYLDIDEYEKFVKNNNYQDIVINNLEIDYVAILNFLNTRDAVNCHSVKPLYVKKIEVEK